MFVLCVFSRYFFLVCLFFFSIQNSYSSGKYIFEIFENFVKSSQRLRGNFLPSLSKFLPCYSYSSLLEDKREVIKVKKERTSEFLSTSLIHKLNIENNTSKKCRFDSVRGIQYPSEPAMFFSNKGILVDRKTLFPLLPFREVMEELTGTIEATYLSNSNIVIKCEINSTDAELVQSRFQIHPVKPLISLLDTELQQSVLRAQHWVQWDNQSRFCGQCGHSLKGTFKSPNKECTGCRQVFFPRFSPAIMVLIQKDNQILLARSPHFPTGVYSALAGFVDIGETAEMAVHREVEEEVGIKIKNLKYVCSQTWPFPDSFMMAFKADYLSNEIKINPEEIEAAHWFSRDKLPKLPDKASIAWKLINSN